MYHHRIGFDLVMLFFDTPDDPEELWPQGVAAEVGLATLRPRWEAIELAERLPGRETTAPSFLNLWKQKALSPK